MGHAVRAGYLFSGVADVAALTGNITRFIASVPGYIYASEDKDIYVNLYVQSKAKVGSVELEQVTGYPWDGNVSLRVNKGSGKFSLKLRIPAWLKASPTNNDLYRYTDNRQLSYTVSVNGEAVEGAVKDGYLTLERNWKKGDVIALSMPMEVRRITANDNVEDLRGKVCLERGPIVYCIEATDQPDNTVFDKYLLDTTPIAAHLESGLLGGVVVLEGQMKKVERNGHVSDISFRAIPYSTWNNRGPQAMAVWVAHTPAAAVPTPAETIASRAKTFSNRGPIQNDAPETAPVDSWAGGVNDQWEPRRSSDNSKPYHYWWLKRGTQEAISYEFDREYEVSNVQVYWLDLDHYDGNFRVPESWALYYKTSEGQWLPVEQHAPFTVLKDCYNSVDFKPVKTIGLKIVAKLQEGQSGGVLEWKVNGTEPGGTNHK